MVKWMFSWLLSPWQPKQENFMVKWMFSWLLSPWQSKQENFMVKWMFMVISVTKMQTLSYIG